MPLHKYRKIYGLHTVFRNSHAGQTHISLTGYNLGIIESNAMSQSPAPCPAHRQWPLQFRVNTNNGISVMILVRELCVGCHDKLAACCFLGCLSLSCSLVSSCSRLPWYPLPSPLLLWLLLLSFAPPPQAVRKLPSVPPW